MSKKCILRCQMSNLYDNNKVKTLANFFLRYNIMTVTFTLPLRSNILQTQNSHLNLHQKNKNVQLL